MSTIKETGIPTIHDISYLSEVLLAICKGDNSFKKLHETVLGTRRRIRNEERVSPSFDEDKGFVDYYQMWAQTAKILRELMALQLVEHHLSLAKLVQDLVTIATIIFPLEFQRIYPRRHRHHLSAEGTLFKPNSIFKLPPGAQVIQ